MHRPAIVVFWEVWRQHRWVLVASGLWLILLSSLCHAMSDGMVFGVEMPVYRHGIVFVLLLATSPLVCGLFPLFAYAVDADLMDRGSTFPARIFTLPLTTRALVGWPMISGTAAVTLAWLAVASLVLRPGGIAVSLWWPAALLAAALAWVQAMAWRPFGVPGLRLLSAIVVIGSLVAMSGLRWMAHFPEAVVSLLLACTIPLAYIVAEIGVSRARRGDQPDWQRLMDSGRAVAGYLSWGARSFDSPSRAQVWFEWRRNGLSLPILTGLMILFWAALIIVNRHNPGLPPNSTLRSPILLLANPLWAAVAVGGSWGRCGSSGGGQAISVFLATRPVTCADLIWAKMKAAAIGAAVVWGMTLAAVVLMVLATGSWGELTGHWSGLTQGFSAAQKAAVAAVGVGLLVAGTWKLMIANMFLGLAGRTWVSVLGAVLMGSSLVAAVPFACWIWMHPEYRDTLVAAVPRFLESAAVLKLLVGAWLVRALTRRHLVQSPLMVRLLAAWLLTAAGLTGVLCWLVLPSFAPWHLVAACVVLSMPLVRVALAPFALAWNRHR